MSKKSPRTREKKIRAWAVIIPSYNGEFPIPYVTARHHGKHLTPIAIFEFKDEATLSLKISGKKGMVIPCEIIIKSHATSKK